MRASNTVKQRIVAGTYPGPRELRGTVERLHRVLTRDERCTDCRMAMALAGLAEIGAADAVCAGCRKHEA